MATAAASVGDRMMPVDVLEIEYVGIREAMQVKLGTKQVKLGEAV